MSSNTSSTTAGKASTTCRLLELPAELRNRIYRDVLVSDHVGIEAHTFSQPAMLKTCCQIRSEATSIYYIESTFYVGADDFDHRLLAAFCQQAGASFRNRNQGMNI